MCVEKRGLSTGGRSCGLFDAWRRGGLWFGSCSGERVSMAYLKYRSYVQVSMVAKLWWAYAPTSKQQGRRYPL